MAFSNKQYGLTPFTNKKPEPMTLESVSKAQTPVVEAPDIGTPQPVVPPVQNNEAIRGAITQAQAQVETLQSQLNQLRSAKEETPQELTAGDLRGQMLSEVYAMRDGFQLSDEARQRQDEAADKQLALDNLTAQMELYNKDTKDQVYEMLKNPEGMTRAALDADVKNFEYDRYARPGGAADQAIEAQFALNNAQHAYQIAQNAYNAEKDQYDSQLNFYKSMYTMLGDDMTEKEAAQYASQLRMYENEVNSLMESKQAALDRAISNNAPEEVLKAIKNAQSAEDVWLAAGQYGRDPSVDLARSNNALAWQKFEWDKMNADRQFAISQAGRLGELSKEEAEKAKVAVAMFKNNMKISSAIGEALNNRLGLRAATGRVKAGPLSYAMVNPLFASASINAREDFENDIKLIAAAQTLEEFSNLGFSLAPVTEKELDLVGSSANELMSSVTLDEEGRMRIDGSTGEFRDNLITLQTQIDAAVEALMNDPNLQRGINAADYAELQSEWTAITGETFGEQSTLDAPYERSFSFSSSGGGSF